MNGPTRKIPAIAEKIKKLEARSDMIRRRLQLPCPTKYGNKEAANGYVRLGIYLAPRQQDRSNRSAWRGFCASVCSREPSKLSGRHAVVSGLHFRYLGDGRLQWAGGVHAHVVERFRDRGRQSSRGAARHSRDRVKKQLLAGGSYLIGALAHNELEVETVPCRLAEKPADGAAEQLCPLS